MGIADHLTKEQKQQLNRIGYRKEKPLNEMSRIDWEEIMGKNRDTYKRVREAVRRK